MNSFFLRGGGVRDRAVSCLPQAQEIEKRSPGRLPFFAFEAERSSWHVASSALTRCVGVPKHKGAVALVSTAPFLRAESKRSVSPQPLTSAGAASVLANRGR